MTEFNEIKDQCYKKADDSIKIFNDYLKGIKKLED